MNSTRLFELLVGIAAVILAFLFLVENTSRNATEVAIWKFDLPVGNLIVDSSGRGNNGTIYGATHVPGKYGAALSFDGMDDSVTVPNSESLHSIQHLTIEAWLMPKSFPPEGLSNSTGIVAYGTKYQGMWELFVMSDGRLLFSLNWNTSAEARVSTDPVLHLNEWQHIAATFDGAMARIYVNGVLKAEGEAPSLIYPGEGSFLAIGDDFPGMDEYFHGLIDDLRIYNRALSPSEFHYSSSVSFLDETGCLG